MSSPDATWRVYLPEWLIVYTSDALGPGGQEECHQHFTGKYQGRVRFEDWRVVPAIFGVEFQSSPCCLQLYVPNLRGEFKDKTDAWWLAQQWTENPQVVQRGSPEEQALLDYGRKMIPDAEAVGGDEK